MTASGLENLGNTCYINAVLQCLRSIPDFVSLIDKHQDKKNLTGAIALLMSAMSEEQVIVRPITVTQLIVTPTNNDFQIDIPGDAHEVLVYIIDTVHEDLSRAVKITQKTDDEHTVIGRLHRQAVEAFRRMYGASYSEMLPLFYGQMLSRVIAEDTQPECHSSTFEPFTSLHVPIPNLLDATLYDCIDLLFREERLDGLNQFYDDKHERYVDARKTHHIYKMPRVLIIALNRHGIRKNTRHVRIPPTLNMQKYLLENRSVRPYHLRCVCHHSGGMNGGHYWACCKRADSGQWDCYDDDEIKSCDGMMATARTAYILLYESHNSSTISQEPSQPVISRQA